MHQYSYIELGQQLTKYGWNTPGTQEEMIRALSDTQKAVCVLSYIAETLNNIDKSMLLDQKQRATSEKQKPEHPVADGMLTVLKRSIPEPDITIDQRWELPLRARQLLVIKKITKMSQVTFENLRERPKGYGPGTIRNLIHWAQKHTKKLPET